MDLIIGILGVIFTTVFGLWAVYLVLRHKDPGHVTFIKEDVIGLFDDIVRNLPDLQVLYKNKPVDKNLVLLKGYFVNTGRKDITADMVDDPLTIILPKEYLWLQAKVVSGQVKANDPEIKNELLEFNLGRLFRCNEYLGFEALAEIPLSDHQSDEDGKQSYGKQLLDSLKFSHRIADTGKVDIKDLPPSIRKSFWKEASFPLSILLLLVLSILPFFIAPKFGWDMFMLPKEVSYLIKTDSGNSIEVVMDIKSDVNATLKGLKDNYNKEVKPIDFLKNKDWEPKIIDDPRQKSVMITMIIFFTVLYPILVISMIVLIVIDRRRTKKTRGILQLATVSSRLNHH